MEYKVGVISGDGIGPEINNTEAKVLDQMERPTDMCSAMKRF